MARLHSAAQTALGHPCAEVDNTLAQPAATPINTGERPALAALRAVFMAHVSFVVEHPGVPRVIFQELQHPGDTALKASVRTLMQQYRQLVMQLLTQAQAANTLAPGVDLPSAAVLFLGSVQGLVMQSLITGDVAAMTRQAPGVFAIFERGVLDLTPSF
ncbi:MAG: TetR family transcriptional regulator [Comamonadaceae bacterium]|nr:MAG: TetR family transcriptional regulator [Comamonadaceae bacterium]